MLLDWHLKKDPWYSRFHSHHQSKHSWAILEPQDKHSSKFCHVCPKWAKEISQPYGKYNEFISADHIAVTAGDQNFRWAQWRKFLLDFLCLSKLFYLSFLVLHFKMHFEFWSPTMYIYFPQKLSKCNKPDNWNISKVLYHQMKSYVQSG